MEYKLYRGYILGPGYQNPAYGIYEVDIYLHKEDVELGKSWHTSESEWEAQLWLDGGPVDGMATQADVDELNRLGVDAEAEYYMISPSGFDIAAVLEVFWKKLRYTSPTELELSLQDIQNEVEMTAERKEMVAGILQRMVSFGLVDKYRR